MKKTLREFILVFIFTSVFLVSAASAASDGLALLVDGVRKAIEILLGNVSGISGASSGEIFFIKLLVFILLFAVVNMVLKRVPAFSDNRAVVVVIALVVSLIAVRYITTEQLINFIWLPYGVLGIVFSVVLPFVIGFFFIEGFDSQMIRKVGWSAYIVIFGGLAIMRWKDFSTGGQWYQNLAWMYLLIAILSFFLLIFDKQLRYAMFMSSLKSVEDVNKRADAARLTKKIEEDRELLAGLTDARARDAVLKRIKQNQRAIKDILRS